jgi:hypothetical protein
MPIQLQIRPYVLDCRGSIGKALGAMRIVHQKVEPLAFHLAAAVALKGRTSNSRKIRESPHDSGKTTPPLD